MSNFISRDWPNNTALEYAGVSLKYDEVLNAVVMRQAWLESLHSDRIVLLLDNQIEWVLFDLACQNAGICCIPVPSFFSEQQLLHVVMESGAEQLICSSDFHSDLFLKLEKTPFENISSQKLTPVKDALIPDGTGKVTFTSGSTGSPKGVCLSNNSQLNVAQSLANALNFESVRHLCLLPFAVLLENIAGVYAPLMAGGTVVIKSPEELGFLGSKLLSPEKLLQQISIEQPNSLILVPELLNVLVAACANGWVPPTSLKFVAVGGGSVSATLIKRAKQFGLPVFQGYGLSECASVVSLNTPQHENVQSAGYVLPHANIEIDDGELVVKGNLFLGYLNQPESFYPDSFKTGDLAEFDGAALSIVGRRKNLIINSFGRNLSPEWLEAEFLATGLFRSALVFGEAMPYCGAILVPISNVIPDQQIETSIEALNASLPDYAQIKVWLRSNETFESFPDCLTPSGKIIRPAVLAHFEQQISNLEEVKQL